MKTFFVNYATPDYKDAQTNSCMLAINAGFDRIIPCGPATLTEQFKKEHEVILSQKAGAGCCLWKPRIILDILSEMEYGDFILYMDVTDVFCKEIREFALSHLNDHGQFFIQTVHKARNFTRKKCFELMGCDTPEYWEAKHVEAGCIGLLKNSFNILLVEEWLKWCSIPDVVIRTPQPDPNSFEDFQRHTYDQSILSNMVIKYHLGTNENSVADGRINYNVYR